MLFLRNGNIYFIPFLDCFYITNLATVTFVETPFLSIY